MDEKDPKDEELNPQGQDDINDADDSFGLPDLEYKPLDVDSDAGTSDDSDESSADEEVESTEDNVEDDNTESSFEDDSNDSEDVDNSEEDETEPQLRYQLEEKSSSAPKIIGGIFAVLAVAVIIWYVGFYRPQQKQIAEAEKARQEEIDKKAKDEADALKAKSDAAAAEEARAAQLAAEAEELAKAGIQILEERTNRYYIVLESFIDGDFARDFGNKIAKEGTPSFLIPPYSKKKMQRVGIGGYETIDEAQTALNDLSGDFGTGKWILKY